MGSYENVYLYFKDAQDDWAGGVQIYFSSPPRYYLVYCSPYINFPTTLPSATEKIWRITLEKRAGIRVKIHCNGVEVANVLLSDQVCYGSYWSYYWSSYWNRDVTQLYFSSIDRASDYYRPYTGN